MIENKGKLIVFEGIGGCGKGTQVSMLEQYYRRMETSVFVTFEHTRDTPVGRMIEDTIKGRLPKIDSGALQLLYTADRANHTANVIRPALGENQVVILDRYYPSTVAYAPEEKRRYFLNTNFGISIRPDLVMILDLDPEEAAKRIGVRGDADIFDHAKSLKRCREGYNWYVKHSGDECVWIDGNGTKDEVHQRVVKEIQRRKLIKATV